MKETTRAAFTKRTPQLQHQRMSLSLRLVFLPTLALSGEILTPNSSLSRSLCYAYTHALFLCQIAPKRATRSTSSLLLAIALAFSLKSPVRFPCTSTRSATNTSLRTNSISSSVC